MERPTWPEERVGEGDVDPVGKESEDNFVEEDDEEALAYQLDEDRGAVM